MNSMIHKRHPLAVCLVFSVLLLDAQLSFDTKTRNYVLKNPFVQASTITYPAEYSGEIQTPGVYFENSPINKDLDLEKEVVEAKDSNACYKIKNEDEVKGKIVLIDANDCYPQTKAKHAQQAGAVGVIIEEYSTKPSLTYLFDGSSHGDLTVPVVQISPSDMKMLKKYIHDAHKKNETLKIQLTQDFDPWSITYGNKKLWYAYTGVYATLYGAVIILALRKICLFKKNKESIRPKLAILIMVIITCVVSIIPTIDPIGTRGIYSDRVSTMMSSARFPFVILTYYWLSLYWGYVGQGLMLQTKNWKKPLFIMGPFFFLAEFGTYPPRYLLYNTGLISTVLIAMYMIFLFGVSVFYLKNAYHVIDIVFHKNTQYNAKDPLRSNPHILNRLKRLTYYIVLIACFAFVILISFAVYISIGVGPISNTWIYWLSQFLVFLINLCEVKLFPHKETEQGAQDSPPTQQEQEMNTLKASLYPAESSSSCTESGTGTISVTVESQTNE